MPITLVSTPQASILFIFTQPYAHVCVLSPFNRVRLFATLWTVARQAPPSMGFSRHEYCSA